MKENSIEEDIILLKDFTESNFKRDKLENYKGSYKMGYFYYKDIQQAIEHILSDYKKLQEDFEQIGNECNRLEAKEFKLENKINKLKEEMEKDKMEQFDDYVIYLIEKYLNILEG